MKSKILTTMLFAVSALLCSHVQAGVIINFDWNSNGGVSIPGQFYEVTGQLELSDLIAVGDPFGAADIVSVDLDLFIDGVFESTASTIEFAAGTRLVNSLSLTDFFVGPIGSRFGCAIADCAQGEIVFSLFGPPQVGVLIFYPDEASALASLVTVQSSEPSTFALLGLGLIALVYANKRKA